jgi:hypothetical protein
MFVLKNLPLPTKVFLICSVFYHYYFDKSVYYFHMFIVLVILFKISSWLFFGDQNVVISFIHVLASLGGSYRSFME